MMKQSGSKGERAGISVGPREESSAVNEGGTAAVEGGGSFEEGDGGERAKIGRTVVKPLHVIYNIYDLDFTK